MDSFSILPIHQISKIAISPEWLKKLTLIHDEKVYFKHFVIYKKKSAAASEAC